MAAPVRRRAKEERGSGKQAAGKAHEPRKAAKVKPAGGRGVEAKPARDARKETPAPVVGMGEHMPAFLRRPARPGKK